MATTYTQCDESVAKLVKSIATRYHRDLIDAAVTFNMLFAHSDGETPAISHGGYPALAQVKIVSLKDRVAGLADATLLIDEAEWRDGTEAQRAALIDHELTHLTVLKGLSGKIKEDEADFFEQYKNPLWQEKRLLVMQRAGFACERCRSKTETLNVHHAYYERDRRPWDYPDDVLHCWCETCHREIHAIIKAMRIALCRMSVKDSRKFRDLAEQLGPKLIPLHTSMDAPVVRSPLEKREELKRRLKAAKSHEEAREILKELTTE